MRKTNRLGIPGVFGAVLVVLILAVVPFAVSAYHFQTGLSEYSWFSGGEDSYDFFLYWKGFLLTSVSLVMALELIYLYVRERRLLLMQVRACYMLPLVLYLLLSVFSAVFSEHRRMAVFGGYEQWEGVVIIGAYVTVLLFSYLVLRRKREFGIVMWGGLAGVLLLSVYSALQAFGYDFLRTDAGRAMMNFMSDKKLNFTFNFEVGRVYSTLHNPNYVGSYVALLFPIVLSLISVERRWTSVVRSMFAGVAAVCLVLMLAGSQSVTGFIGVFASFLLFAVYWLVRNRARPGRIFICAGGCVLVAVMIILTNQPVFEYGYNKIMHPTPNRFLIKSMETEEGQLRIETADDEVLFVNTGHPEDAENPYEFRDGDGKKLSASYDKTAGKWKVPDKRFAGIELQETRLTDKGTEYEAIKVQTPSMGKTYTVAKKEKGNGALYVMQTASGKLGELEHIEAMGFEDRMHFGSRRGYIWSRTFPLLRNHLLLGSGPSTFVYEFPNHDYVGRLNVGYEWSVVTKPHNMFLQIWVQTGLLSLLAFLVLYIVYFVESIQIYFGKKEIRLSDAAGIGIMLGTFGYLVTGLANDSCVAVAPLYWVLLGTGMALNRFNRMQTD